MFTVKFARRSAERAIKSAAAGAMLAIAPHVTDARLIDWSSVGYYGIGAGVISLIMSAASAQSGDPESPSLVD